MSLSFASLLVSQQASADDLYVPPSLKDGPGPVAPSLWSGFYQGGHLGGAWGNAGVNDDFTYVGDPAFNGSPGSAGFIGGAQAGYNIQRGHFVFGLEGDFGYLGISASKPVSFKPGSCTGHYSDGTAITYDAANGNQQLCDIDAKYSSSSDLYGDLTARLGYAVDRTLFYVKGGAAFLDADFKANYSGQNCVTALPTCFGATHQGPSMFNYDHSDTLAGWTVGVGVEYALNSAWSLKAEYQHFDFGSMSYSYSGCVNLGFPGGGACPVGNSLPGHFVSTLNGKTDVSFTADAITLGVNYHLNN